MLCVVCQQQHRTPVRLDDGQDIPCCPDCWQQIPEGQRLVIAQKIKTSAVAERAWTNLSNLIERHLEQDGEHWLFGGRN